MTYCLVSVAWKHLSNIQNVISDAKSSTLPPDEIVVIINPYNDSDTNDIRNFVKSCSDITRWVDCSDNIGCATAWNIGMFANTSDYCVVVNDDCRVGPGTYESMIAGFNDPKVGLVGVCGGGFAGDKVVTPQGFLFAVRKSALYDHGGFNEIASPLADEVEFGLRISRSYKSIIVDNCQYYHTHDISNNPCQPIKYLGQYINVRSKQLDNEWKLKLLQEQHNRDIGNI